MASQRQKILFIGWDAADWKAINPLMDAGKMPNLQSLVERGSMGRVATLNPPLSPMLWTSIATGKRPFKHGIHGFSEPTPDGRSVRPITNLSRTAKAVWNILNQNGWRSTVIGWWPSHPAEPIDGVMVSDHYHRASRPLSDQGVKAWPLLANAVYPPELHDTLAELRLHPQELVGPMLKPFVPALEKVDQDKDRRFSSLCKTIAECASIHSAATWLIENRPWDFFAVYYDAIDHFCHGFMKYHPPRRPFISEEDFELYSNVISTAYIMHDQMLGTLLRKAAAQEGGENTRVILMSDHGFHPDHLRPSSIPDFPAGPAVEHSRFGIFVMAGPGIKKDESLLGVSVLDLTPTVLTLCGLPVGADMDGEVVTSAFEDPPEVKTIPSWEDVPGNDGRHPAHTRLDPVAAAEALEQLVALGYIEKPGENAEAYVETTIRELRFNLLEAYQDANRHGEAIEIARDLSRRDPDNQRYALKHFLSCQALGLTVEMREIADDMGGRRRGVFEEAAEQMKALRDLTRQRYEEKKTAAGETPDDEECRREIAYELNPRAEPGEPREFLLKPEERKPLKEILAGARYNPAITDLMQAEVLSAEKRWFEALAAVERLAGHQGRPATLLQSGDLLRRLGRHAEAERKYREALAFDPDNTHAWLGICRVELRRRDYRAAVNAALECRGRLPFYPMVHFLEGIAWRGLGDYPKARDCFLKALSQNPNFPQAHLWLARLLRFRLDDEEGAREHFRWYKEMRRSRRSEPAPIEAHRVELAAEQPGSDTAPVSLPPISDEVLVVSGLPRSGTSMLMQMLDAGGVSILTDGARAADEDNPRGYFEVEAAKRLLRDQSWLSGARGKAVKIVAPLVCSLPAGFRYRVILIERDYDEILESQAAMIRRRGEPVQDSSERRDRLRREYARVIAQTRTLLSKRADVQLLILRHENILRDPGEASSSIGNFAGGTLDTAHGRRS
jgi:predicted AlkP superfamily phosphohydrolase/phosphomutase/tetratricopeptide (TPR) repeat protein